jgi:Copper type II ascorbate-dependent monooxygenase, C-terminal domain/Copper type II ascorbate-dependent monooxygenase, N-terminal domain
MLRARTTPSLLTVGLLMVGLLTCIGLAACGSESNQSPTGGAGGTGTGAGAGGNDELLPCDVSDMLAFRCQQCHASEPKFGAPMPLVTRSNLLADSLQGNTVAEECLARMQADDRMPPPPNEVATAAEVAVLQAWLDAGSPPRTAGDECGGAAGGGGAGGAVGCTPDLELVGQQPFEMPATSTDEQVCFGIDFPASADKRHITAILPKIDNDTIIHHILLLQSPTAVSSDPQPCGFTNVDWKLLYAWGPGTPAHVLPSAAGFPMDADTEQHFVLQVHYNNLQGLSGQMDQSGVDLCTTTDLREHDADIMAFGSTGFDGIVPMATSELDCTTPLPSLVDPYFPVTIFQSWPHMHQIGAGLTSVIEHGDGSTTELANVPNYDFNFQLTYDNDAVLDVGDTVRTVCTWDNNTAQTVGFGEDTADEMCFNFVSYYPRIDAPVWSWLAPAQIASCNMSVQ